MNTVSSKNCILFSRSRASLRLPEAFFVFLVRQSLSEHSRNIIRRRIAPLGFGSESLCRVHAPLLHALSSSQDLCTAGEVQCSMYKNHSGMAVANKLYVVRLLDTESVLFCLAPFEHWQRMSFSVEDPLV